MTTQRTITLLPRPAADAQPWPWHLVSPLLSLTISIPAIACTWAIMYYSAESNRDDRLVLMSPFYLVAATPYAGLVMLSYWARHKVSGAVFVLVGTLILAVLGRTSSTMACTRPPTPQALW